MNWTDAIPFLAGITEAAIGAVVGTIAGAYVALRHDREKRLLEQADARIVAANQVIFSLMRAWADIETYRRQIIEPCRYDKARWWTLRPCQPPTSAAAPNLAPLAFLLESADAEVLNQTAVAWAAFEQLQSLVSDHQHLHLSEVQPAVERGVPATGPALPSELRAAIGPRLAETLERRTDTLVEYVDQLLPDLRAASIDLQQAVKRLYPDRKVLNWEPGPISTNAPKGTE